MVKKKILMGTLKTSIIFQLKNVYINFEIHAWDMHRIIYVYGASGQIVGHPRHDKGSDIFGERKLSGIYRWDKWGVLV